MKKLIIILFTILSVNTFAQTEISSTINSVKVYRQNAEITREVSVNLINGTQEVVLTGISTLINPSSLQIQFSGSKSSLLSAKYEKNYLAPKINSAEIEELISKLEKLEEEIAWISDQKYILGKMEDILNKNQSLGGTTQGFTPKMVIELTNSYRKKVTEIRTEFKTLLKQEKGKTLERSRIQGQLNEKRAIINKPSGNIVLQIASKGSENVQIKCMYIVSNAGWNPIYDLRSSGITENVELNYKANVYQNTGLDWNNVNVVISTGNPLQNNNRPVLTPLYADIITVRGISRNRQGESKHLLNQPSVDNMAYVNGDYSDGYRFESSVVIKNMNIEFDVFDRQNISSDGKENLMALKTYDLNTEYIYHSVPKLNKGAFLLAKVSDWGQYNLIAGEANIFFEGAFVGKSNINPNVTSDTLLISMGRDNNISITRKSIKEFTSSNLLGKNKELEIIYEITILNKKSTQIEIEILDQIPVSKNEKIEIILDEKGTSEYVEKIGKLLWTLNIQPGQSKTEKFGYTVKYPKKEMVSGMK